MTPEKAIAIWKELATSTSQINVIVTDSRREALWKLIEMAEASLQIPQEPPVSQDLPK